MADEVVRTGSNDDDGTGVTCGRPSPSSTTSLASPARCSAGAAPGPPARPTRPRRTANGSLKAAPPMSARWTTPPVLRDRSGRRQMDQRRRGAAGRRPGQHAQQQSAGMVALDYLTDGSLARTVRAFVMAAEIQAEGSAAWTTPAPPTAPHRPAKGVEICHRKRQNAGAAG